MAPLTDEQKAARKEETLALGWDNLEPDDYDYVVSDFDDIDANGDGTLDKDEVTKYCAAGSVPTLDPRGWYPNACSNPVLALASGQRCRRI